MGDDRGWESGEAPEFPWQASAAKEAESPARPTRTKSGVSLPSARPTGGGWGGFSRPAYSHSMVAGGLELMSRSTRETPRTSLVMREEILASRS
jgi:hypothetical protein